MVSSLYHTHQIVTNAGRVLPAVETLALLIALIAWVFIDQVRVQIGFLGLSTALFWLSITGYSMQAESTLKLKSVARLPEIRGKVLQLLGIKFGYPLLLVGFMAYALVNQEQPIDAIIKVALLACAWFSVFLLALMMCGHASAFFTIFLIVITPTIVERNQGEEAVAGLMQDILDLSLPVAPVVLIVSCVLLFMWSRGKIRTIKFDTLLPYWANLKDSNPIIKPVDSREGAANILMFGSQTDVKSLAVRYALSIVFILLLMEMVIMFAERNAHEFVRVLAPYLIMISTMEVCVGSSRSGRLLWLRGLGDRKQIFRIWLFGAARIFVFSAALSLLVNVAYAVRFNQVVVFSLQNAIQIIACFSVTLIISAWIRVRFRSGGVFFTVILLAVQSSIVLTLGVTWFMTAIIVLVNLVTGALMLQKLKTDFTRRDWPQQAFSGIRLG